MSIIQKLESVPTLTYHCLGDLPRYATETLSLVSEYVIDSLCKLDPEFTAEYLSMIFGAHKKHYKPKSKSGLIKIYSPQFMVYFCEPQKSWLKIPTGKNLKTWKEIKEILKNES